MSRIWNIFSAQPEVKDKEASELIQLIDVKGDIHFDHVHFGYQKDTAVIEDLNFISLLAK